LQDLLIKKDIAFQVEVPDSYLFWIGEGVVILDTLRFRTPDHRLWLAGLARNGGFEWGAGIVTACRQEQAKRRSKI
jgi:hypothetical protein